MSFHTKPTAFVGHVQIKVENLKRALSFYQDTLGFEILEQTTSSVKLTVNGKDSILSLEQPEDVLPKQVRTTGLYHFAILLPKRVDLANLVIHLSKQGIPFGSSDHHVSEALYLNDLDGNGIEIYVDRSSSEWIWIEDEVTMTVDPLDFENLLAIASPELAWPGMPEGTVMGHIHLHVSELEKTEEFYVKGLGLDVVNRFGGQALFLSSGKYHHHIGVNLWNGKGAPRPSHNSVGLKSFTLVLPDGDTRLKVIENIKCIGGSVIEEDTHYIVFDPSGNRILLEV
ncbi:MULTISPECIES: VOC family protein [unclassified Sporosarcina]|uniref:VOC family protein n=1 Tax=unclassified Sporosarcina TaxID=2647733 RepID=UPI00203D81D3|nr:MULTISPECIES: VOC family protein [unclassified Sporosarcina]GKV65064.1 glyoxalase [Sporosarcina sp. NCCP-2331]GLB56895.1 glyoxalase [Sporosarcina sp. NCCP-2378]